MQLKLFALPIKNMATAEAEMNAFLRGHRVLAVKKEFVPDGENSFGTFCVEYLSRGTWRRSSRQWSTGSNSSSLGATSRSPVCSVHVGRFSAG